MLNLHEQLIKDADVPLPTFPPKKFFPLTMTQQEERRVGLEKYIQTIGQNPVINSSELLNGFLLNAQQEAVNGPFENEYLDIFLSNDYKVTINVSTKENSGQVLKVFVYIIKNIINCNKSVISFFMHTYIFFLESI